MSKSKTEVVYEQLGRTAVIGRVISVRGRLEAQVVCDSDFQRANARQAARLLRNALSVNLLTPGNEVVAWAGNRLVRGHYTGCSTGLYEVSLGRGRASIYTGLIMPYHAAVQEGVWPFRQGMQVAAEVDEKWVKARWIAYFEGVHIVELSDGSQVEAERVHIAADAIRLGIFSD